MLTSKGLLGMCEDHRRPLRTCFGLFAAGRNPTASRKVLWKQFLYDLFGETKGCCVSDCRKLPAIFWVKCRCGCGASARVCRRHRSKQAWLCTDANVPPNGTGTVYRQQVKKL